MRKNIYLIIIILLTGLVAFFIFWRGDNPQQALGQEVELYIYTAENESTGGATLSLPFIKESSKAGIVNAAVDIDNDGIFSQDEWLVRNGLARAYPDYRNNFNFNVSELEVGQTYQARVLITSQSITDLTTLSQGKAGEFSLLAKAHELLASFYQDDSGEIWFGGPGRNFNTQLISAVQAKGQLDVFVPNMPDLPQGPNECGPVSVANGITHLADKNDQLDDFTSKLNDDIF